ncbi:lipopolysaccharide biosynthesis protein [Haloarcula sp. NS06]|uniref:lipopolysaccharide biosynthesis protein n=1 Tax=Haloarcula sp. NS06 TaxID=3409688 RepID=UPI003DA6DB57
MDERRVIGTVYAVVMGINIVLITIGGSLYLFAGSSLDEYQPFYVATLAFLMIQGAFRPMIALLRATLKSKVVTLFMMVRAVSMLVLSVLIVLFVYDHIAGWIWGRIIGISIGILLIVAVSDALRVMPRIDRGTLIKISGYGLPMVGWIMGDPLLNQADRFLIEVLRDSATVGIYASNYSLADRGMRLVMIPLLDAIQPIVINKWNGDNVKEIEGLLRQFTRYFLILSVPALVLLGALSRPLSEVFLGQEFHEGFIVIPVVGAGVLMWSFSNIGQIGLEIQERTALMSRGLLLCVVFNVVANVPLIIAYGYVGAAVGTFLSYGAYSVFVFWSSRERIEWDLPVRTIWSVFLAGSAMAAIPLFLYVTNRYTMIRLLLLSFFLPFIYFLVLYQIGEITRDNIAQIREFV